MWRRHSLLAAVLVDSRSRGQLRHVAGFSQRADWHLCRAEANIQLWKNGRCGSRQELPTGEVY
eukprot:scaffold51315_cov298-Isochrysis_galbana.AAC.1